MIVVNTKSINLCWFIWIIMKGISDIESIITVYTAIINANSELLKKLGCKDIKAVVSHFPQVSTKIQ